MAVDQECLKLWHFISAEVLFNGAIWQLLLWKVVHSCETGKIWRTWLYQCL